MDAIFDRFARIPILQKVLGLVGVAVVLGILFYFLAMMPLQDKEQKGAKELDALKGSLAEKKQMVADLAQYKRDVEKLNQELQKAVKLLPNSLEIPSLLQKVSSLANKSGLDIVLFQPAPEVPQDFYAKVPVNLELRGAFNEVTNFFDAVGKLSRIVNIGTFSFKIDDKAKPVAKVPGNEGGQKKVLTVTCVATTFRFINNDKEPAKDAKDAKGNPAPAANGKPGEAKPADAKPADAKPADAKPADAKPADAKPADAKPADAKPADAKPAEKK